MSRSKEQVCHELAMQFAIATTPKDGEKIPNVLLDFEYDERLLCVYTFQYEVLIANYNKTLDGYYNELGTRRPSSSYFLED